MTNNLEGISAETVLIPITKGCFIIVDAEDAPSVSKRKWHLKENVSGNQYAVTCINGKSVRLHRMLLQASMNMEVDHINGDGLDNRRANLRVCIHSQNQANQKKNMKLKNVSSKYKGVSRKPSGSFQVVLTKDYKKICIGVFKCEIEAAKAYDAAALKHFGKFSNLNFGGNDGR